MYISNAQFLFILPASVLVMLLSLYTPFRWIFLSQVKRSLTQGLYTFTSSLLRTCFLHSSSGKLTLCVLKVSAEMSTPNPILERDQLPSTHVLSVPMVIPLVHSLNLLLLVQYLSAPLDSQHNDGKDHVSNKYIQQCLAQCVLTNILLLNERVSIRYLYMGDL